MNDIFKKIIFPATFLLSLVFCASCDCLSCVCGDEAGQSFSIAFGILGAVALFIFVVAFISSRQIQAKGKVEVQKALTQGIVKDIQRQSGVRPEGMSNTDTVNDVLAGTTSLDKEVEQLRKNKVSEMNKAAESNELSAFKD